MCLTLIVKDPEPNPDDSPTLYRTDRDSWVVQGWTVTDREALSQVRIPPGEGCVEIPDRMIPFFTPGNDVVDTAEEFDELIRTFGSSAIHLESRDAYGTAVELPYLAMWRAGKPDDLACLDAGLLQHRARSRSGRPVGAAREDRVRAR